jgi:hypothetical protein
VASGRISSSIAASGAVSAPDFRAASKAEVPSGFQCRFEHCPRLRHNRVHADANLVTCAVGGADRLGREFRLALCERDGCEAVERIGEPLSVLDALKRLSAVGEPLCAKLDVAVAKRGVPQTDQRDPAHGITAYCLGTFERVASESLCLRPCRLR